MIGWIILAIGALCVPGFYFLHKWLHKPDAKGLLGIPIYFQAKAERPIEEEIADINQGISWVMRQFPGSAWDLKHIRSITVVSRTFVVRTRINGKLVRTKVAGATYLRRRKVLIAYIRPLAKITAHELLHYALWKSGGDPDWDHRSELWTELEKDLG